MYKVVIVEDDPMVSMINKHYIEQDKRFSVVECFRSGDEAFRYLQNNPVDLAMLDIYMPGLDGLSLLKKIRMENINTDVIMVTASNDKNTFDTTLKLGVIDYLVKPFVQQRFQQSLDKFIQHIEAEENLSVLSQKNIDSIIGNTKIDTDDSAIPKGIQIKTLNNIRKYIAGNYKQGKTAEQISSELGITCVTVRRYMKYLTRKGEVTEQLDYETGGRPCMIYYKK